ncbi:MAG TPA: thiamine-phosphate kinase [Lamprocystis sp. (in: g-proteobacteria)]|nr:thiamine-phosphate kinase [Lamprocystis sp. (in: g-proteobacteria)]
MSEFELIRACFASLGAARADVVLGVGDDCALLAVPSGRQLAVSIDTLASGVHFLPDCSPEAIGHKCLAVGLSDLAAMAALPAWATLAITMPATLPSGSPDWLPAFARGFGRLALAHGVSLVGGDTTSGPLSITVQVHGFVAPGAEVKRAGARPGDLICVSGTLGDAGLALRELLAGRVPAPALRARLERPTPRVGLGLALSGVASAMIDCSDGLAADLGHVLTAGAVAGEINLAALPLSDAVAAVVAADGDWGLPLAAGDDYELCFCVPPDYFDRLVGIGAQCCCRLTVIGRVRPGAGLVCLTPNGRPLALARSGFDHFGSATN